MSRLNLLQELIPNRQWGQTYARKRLFKKEPQDIETLCRSIMQSDGEHSSLLFAERALNAFESLSRTQKVIFFKMLAEKYDLDIDKLQSSTEHYREKPNKRSLVALTNAAQPARRELLRRLNQVPNGTQRLVKMREELKALSSTYPDLEKIDVDFKQLFNAWFNRGFLILEPIDWSTPANILEKIITYEAVHEISSWRELRARLEPEDRFCFAFFHPVMQDEPLVFVEVALCENMPEHLEQILVSERTVSERTVSERTVSERTFSERTILDPSKANCAVFYSISNCHAGLAGVSFGNFLIKQVATRLQQQFAQLKTFCTLSPSPGFKSWLSLLAEQDQGAHELLLNATAPNAVDTSAQKASLLSYAAQYYLNAKTQYQTALDSVAHFHLKNGARLERLNHLANPSEKGRQQSLGLMVNYVYELGSVEQNHEDYVKHHKISSSNEIRKLASK